MKAFPFDHGWSFKDEGGIKNLLDRDILLSVARKFLMVSEPSLRLIFI